VKKIFTALSHLLESLTSNRRNENIAFNVYSLSFDFLWKRDSNEYP